ncbi:MAG TPA: hypothetical protein VLL76_05870 [Candidatus Omnitrophota bacterium]|nr:hypothetical protein [Candidatus Omnitrophota bacterium]
MRRLIHLSEAELADLMREARSELGRTLPLTFGLTGVALIADAAPWAVPMLDQWRGVTVADGGGI